jgi:glycine cleavage system transcriptional repressor
LFQGKAFTATNATHATKKENNDETQPENAFRRFSFRGDRGDRCGKRSYNAVRLQEEPMKKLVALTAIGRDRPGIVASLSKVLYEKGCNLEDSSMTRLKGDFAILLLIALPSGLSAGDLESALKASNRDLTLSLRELSPDESGEGPASSSLPFTLMVYGVDHPGIVYRVAQEAAELKVNITDLRTHVTQSAGNDLYTLIMEVEVPGAQVLEGFRGVLENLKKELKVEMALNQVETDEL